jgi:hypothetical protein
VKFMHYDSLKYTIYQKESDSCCKNCVQFNYQALLYDALEVYHLQRPNMSEKKLKEFASGVAALIEVEQSIENYPEVIITGTPIHT